MNKTVKKINFPILAESVWIDGDDIRYIDETHLPHAVKKKSIKCLKDAGVAIGELRIRALGQVFLALNLLIKYINKHPEARKEDLHNNIEQIARYLAEVRPTFPFFDILRPYQTFIQNCSNETDVGKEVKEKIRTDMEKLKAKRIKRAEYVAQLIEDGDSILTHCNTSGDMVIMAEVCRANGKAVSFFVTETRPHLQGARLTAWELNKAGFPVTLISDSAVARVLSKGLVQVAVTGADRCTLNGDIINKVGTYQIALLAKTYKIPFYVMAQSPSNIASGNDIPIEFRSDSELLNYPQKNHYSKKINSLFPCFDVTPASYVNKIINFQGIMNPEEMATVSCGKIL